MDKSEIFLFCKNKIASISSDMNIINSERLEALKYYENSPDIAEYQEGRSKAVTTDLMDTIEWMMPALLEVFCGQDKAISIEPAEGTDVRAAELLDMLINYQLQVKNKWYLICHDWFKDALLLKTGVLKYSWNKEKKSMRKSYKELTEQELRLLGERPNASIISVQSNIIQEELTDQETGEILVPREALYDVDVQFYFEDEFPKIEVVPPEDFGFNPNISDIDTADFVYHRIYMPKWQAKEVYDYVGVDWEALKTGQTLDDASGLNQLVKETRASALGLSWLGFKDSKDYLVIYECYYRDPKTGEPKISILCDNQVIYDGYNDYGRPPFIVITPIKMSHKILGYSMNDLICDIQKLRTALLRQIIDNLYQTNFRRYFVDPSRVNMDDYLDVNVTNAAIRVMGDPRTCVMPEEKAPIPPETFMFWETLQVERDYHSGIPRSYQGVVPSVQHRTARGQNQQVQLASQRIQALSRMIAEMGMKELIMAVIDMNIRFLNKKTSVRYLNEWVEINPDNIIGKYDVKVSVGLGVPDKETIIVQCQQLLGIYSMLYRAGINIVNAQNVYNLISKILNAMNIKNIADYITEPSVIEGLAQVYQMILPMLAKNPEAMQQVSTIFANAGVPIVQIQQAIQQQMSAEQIGAEAPVQAAQPVQPIAPRTTPQGRGYYP